MPSPCNQECKCELSPNNASKRRSVCGSDCCVSIPQLMTTSTTLTSKWRALTIDEEANSVEHFKKTTCRHGRWLPSAMKAGNHTTSVCLSLCFYLQYSWCNSTGNLIWYKKKCYFVIAQIANFFKKEWLPVKCLMQYFLQQSTWDERGFFYSLWALNWGANFFILSNILNLGQANLILNIILLDQLRKKQKWLLG